MAHILQATFSNTLPWWKYLYFIISIKYDPVPTYVSSMVYIQSRSLHLSYQFKVFLLNISITHKANTRLYDTHVCHPQTPLVASMFWKAIWLSTINLKSVITSQMASFKMADEILCNFTALRSTDHTGQWPPSILHPESHYWVFQTCRNIDDDKIPLKVVSAPIATHEGFMWLDQGTIEKSACL